MLRHLHTKLTLLYAGLFGLVLLGSACLLHPLLATWAIKAAEGELKATASVFEQIETLQTTQMRDNARIAASDFGFRSAAALADQDQHTIRTALDNLGTRLNVDMAVFIRTDGMVFDDTGMAFDTAAISTVRLFETEEASGVIVQDGKAYRAVATPVYAPDRIGWLVTGSGIGDPEMSALAALSPIPLAAGLAVRTGQDWQSLAGGAAATEIDRAPSLREFLAIDTLDGSTVRLQLSYPKSQALETTRTLSGLLLCVALAGLGILSAAAWLLARSITRPLSMLEAATRRIEEGDYSPVAVPSRDEVGRLADGFNLMARAIEERTSTITHLALHDRDTDLPNREHLERALAALEADPGTSFVCAVGIDRFSQIRDAIGYGPAGTLVAALGQRLSSREGLTKAARLSNDQLGFAFSAPGRHEAEAWLGEALDAFEHPVTVNGQAVDISATIGFAPLEDHGAIDHSVIERASIALDQARRAGRRVAAFDARSYGDPVANLSLMGDMIRALSDGEVFLVHQPKLNLRTGAIDSVEALVRWKHRERGFLPPDLFIPVAEETGRIRELTEFVLRQAAEDQAVFAQAGWPLAVSVNISGRLLSEASFRNFAENVLRRCDGKMCLEITETAVMQDVDAAISQLDSFRAAGAAISIDDYGSGLSSLAYLKRLPAQELKIDRSLLKGLGETARDLFLLKSTVDLGHGLGMKVVVEGIEDPTTLAAVQAIGCDMAQGYYISRPLTRDALLDFLETDGWKDLCPGRRSA